MFSNGFVASVKGANSQILREYDGQKVFLPFNSEYSLFLKNTNPVRAKIGITIDGTDILGGHQLIINGYGDAINLERFIVDEDMNKGRKLLFVPAGDSRVQDPTSAENGIVKVTFTKEWVMPVTTFYTSPYYNSGSIKMSSSSNCFASNMQAVNCCDTGSVGATVEGSKSNQQFVESSGFMCESFSTIITLLLVGNEKAVTARETRKQYCASCGAKVKFNDNFCASCGARN